MQLSNESNRQAMVAEQIEGGQYFVQAKKWYDMIYLYPYTQAFYTLMMLLLLLSSVIVAIGILNMQYTSKKIPFAVYADDQVSFISYIRPLAVSYENTNISIARYLAEYYVKLRETYSPGLLDEGAWQNFFERVQATSSRRVFSEFVRYMDTQSNPMSPVLLYRTNVERMISVTYSVFPEGHYNKPDHVTVYFKATERGREFDETQAWKAELTFDMSDMYTNADEQSSMYFTVIKYKVTPVSSSGTTG